MFNPLTPDSSSPAGTDKLVVAATRTGSRGFRRRVAVLPSLLTLGNLLCGFLAIFYATKPINPAVSAGEPALALAAAFIFAGMLFDVLDGRVARMTHNTSIMGAELDSLADVVTFGVAPAFLVVYLIGVQSPFNEASTSDYYLDRAVLVVACIYASCTAVRLARFNVETRSPDIADHTYFNGLPSPAAAGTLASLVLLHQHLQHAHFDRTHWAMRTAALSMVAVMFLTALAMVSRLRYVHVMNRYFRGRVRYTTIGRVIIIILLLAIWWQYTLAGLLVVYALTGPVIAAWRKISGTRPPPPGEPPRG